MSDAIYEHEDGVYRPLKWAGSPWSHETQHGGPANGIFAREAEILARDTGMQIARNTIDLFKAIPKTPLAAETKFIRKGGRIAVLETVLKRPEDETPISRAVTTLLRPSDVDDPFWRTADIPPPAVESTPMAPALAGGIAARLPPGFHEKVIVRSGADEVGPFVWLSTPLSLVEGEPITDLQRATTLTDMTLGCHLRMTARERQHKPEEPGRLPRVMMINTDTTIYWERPVQGEFLGMRPALLTQERGIATAEVVLYDASGRVGRATQSALAQSSMPPPNSSKS